jgi:hypothetical protein
LAEPKESSSEFISKFSYAASFEDDWDNDDDNGFVQISIATETFFELEEVYREADIAFLLSKT